MPTPESGGTIKKTAPDSIKIIILIVVLLVFPVKMTHAYVDPGTGSYLIQIILGALFGILYATKNLWRGVLLKIKNKIKKNKQS